MKHWSGWNPSLPAGGLHCRHCVLLATFPDSDEGIAKNMEFCNCRQAAAASLSCPTTISLPARNSKAQAPPIHDFPRPTGKLLKYFSERRPRVSPTEWESHHVGSIDQGSEELQHRWTTVLEKQTSHPLLSEVSSTNVQVFQRCHWFLAPSLLNTNESR